MEKKNGANTLSDKAHGVYLLYVCPKCSNLYINSQLKTSKYIKKYASNS